MRTFPILERLGLDVVIDQGIFFAQQITAADCELTGWNDTASGISSCSTPRKLCGHTDEALPTISDSAQAHQSEPTKAEPTWILMPWRIESLVGRVVVIAAFVRQTSAARARSRWQQTPWSRRSVAHPTQQPLYSASAMRSTTRSIK